METAIVHKYGSYLGKYTVVGELVFVDLAECWDGIAVDIAVDLLTILKRPVDHGFWHNRGYIFTDLPAITVVFSTTSEILGFYICKRGGNDIWTIYIMEAFESGKGIGRAMAEYAKARHPGVICNSALSGTMGFWEKVGIKEFTPSSHTPTS